MISVDAAYNDSHSSTRREVQIEFLENDFVIIHGDGVESRLSFAAIRVSPRLGNTPRYLHLSNGALCEVADNDVVDKIVDRLKGYQASRFLHFLERRYATAIVALILTIGIVGSITEYGIPQLSRHLAFSLPQDIETSFCRESLEVLDRGMFTPSQIDEMTEMRVLRLFETLRPKDAVESGLRLTLRSSERLGANAFALLAGYVVVTDSLIELVESDEELIAVMAHEIGHVKHRQILRQVLQNSLTGLLVAGLFGDPTSIAGLSATLPTFLVQQKYSMQLEQEADRYAAEVLRGRNVPVTHLVTILKRLAIEQTGRHGKVLDYLSSHPATDRRIKALLEN